MGALEIAKCFFILIGFIPAMHSLVFNEIVRSNKLFDGGFPMMQTYAFSTDIANKGLVTGIRAKMD